MCETKSSAAGYFRVDNKTDIPDMVILSGNKEIVKVDFGYGEMPFLGFSPLRPNSLGIDPGVTIVTKRIDGVVSWELPPGIDQLPVTPLLNSWLQLIYTPA